MKKYRALLSFLLLSLIHVSIFAQQKKEETPFLKNKNWLDFVIIKIDHHSEIDKRYEVDVVYLKNKVFKIHSIVNSDAKTEKKIDTVFTLNETHLKTLERFYDAFQRNVFPPSKLNSIGSGSQFSCTVDGETITISNKTEYSLIEELLKK